MRFIVCAALAALCVVANVQAKSRHHQPASQSGKFDYYVLSLSWSPTFCESHKTNPQCSAHPGFVLHGLWPQFASGGYPQHCSTSEALTEEARTVGIAVFPTEELMVHEWQTHGTCSGATAIDYFKTAQRAHESIQTPSRLQSGAAAASLTAQQISRLLRDANPGITTRSLTVVCVNKELSEVRVCLSRDDLRPMSCGGQAGGSCGTPPVNIPGVR